MRSSGDTRASLTPLSRAQNVANQGRHHVQGSVFAQGRVALVTGGSRGIGKMIAAGFLAQGAAKVYITARKAGPCEATAKELTAAI